MTVKELGGRIVVDWGSSNFRAFRFDAAGNLADRHQAQAGILTVQDGAFEALMMREIGQWITPDSEILLSGMITSRNGWVETPYVEAPATLADLAAGAVTRKASNGARLLFLPGVCTRHPTPDVMRGEEIQVFGSLGDIQTAMLILPGTHSKWVNVTDGAIAGFRTFLTGECFALLRSQSIVGRLIPPGERAFDEKAFLAGVMMAQGAASISLLNDVFTARSGALLGDFSPETIADRLSGMLVGHEIKAGLSLQAGAVDALILVGETELTARYQLALHALGREARMGPTHAAVDGFRRLVAARGG